MFVFLLVFQYSRMLGNFMRKINFLFILKANYSALSDTNVSFEMLLFLLDLNNLTVVLMLLVCLRLVCHLFVFQCYSCAFPDSPST